MTIYDHLSGDPSKPRSWSKYANDGSLKKSNEATNVKSRKQSTDFTETNKDEKENEEIKKALEKVYTR